MSNRSKRLALLATVLLLPLVACDDSGLSSGTGRLTLQLTDAPGEAIVAAHVTFTDVYLQARSGESDPESSRFYLLEDGDVTEELTSLANAVTTIIQDVPVPTGTYDQLRVVMSGACIETESGAIYASEEGYDLCGEPTGHLQMPSMRQSGVKVQLHGLEVFEGRQIWLMDFVVDESFGHRAGRSGMWVMHPVIHTSRVELTSEILVTLQAGGVTLPDGFELGQFSATLLPTEGDTARMDFTDGDADGVFNVDFTYLIPDQGPFDVRLNGPEGLDWTVDPASPQTLELDSAETETVDWVLQSAAEAEEEA